MRNILFIGVICIASLMYGCANQPSSVLSSAEEIPGIYEGQNNPNAYITIRVTGKGIAPEGITNPAQAKILSERAAEADGYRLLAEKLRGLLVTTFQTTRHAQVTEDIIHTQTAALLRATQIVDIRHYPDGLAEVDMVIRINKNYEYF